MKNALIYTGAHAVNIQTSIFNLPILNYFCMEFFYMQQTQAEVLSQDLSTDI